jgi:hypothetical protein
MRERFRTREKENMKTLRQGARIILDVFEILGTKTFET